MTPSPLLQAAPTVAGYAGFEHLWEDEGYAFVGAVSADEAASVILKIPQRTLDARERAAFA